jgi:hypothetical protein
VNPFWLRPWAKPEAELGKARLVVASPQSCRLFREHAPRELLNQAFEAHRYQSGVDDARGQIRLGDDLLYMLGLGVQAIVNLSLGFAELQLAGVKKRPLCAFGGVCGRSAYVLGQLLTDMSERFGDIFDRIDQSGALLY